MENQITKLNEIQLAKQKAWGNFGLALSDKEEKLALNALEIGKKISIEPSQGNINQCVIDLAEAKRLLNALIEERKETTNRLDKVKSRLMDHEKIGGENLAAYEKKIISIKQEIEIKNQKIRAIEEEKIELAQKVKQSYIDFISDCNKLVDELVLETYLEMLNSNLPIEDFDLAVKTASAFSIPDYKSYFAKQNFKQVHISDVEKALIYTNNKSVLPDFTAEFIEKMNLKKVGYKSELANVEASKALMEKERKEAEKARNEANEMAKLAVKIETSEALQAEPKAEVKLLKKTFVLDMPDSHETALVLFAQFSANINKILPELKVTKWLSFTPAQIGNVLAKLKSKDNSIEFSGITFKSVDKL